MKAHQEPVAPPPPKEPPPPEKKLELSLEELLEERHEEDVSLFECTMPVLWGRGASTSRSQQAAGKRSSAMRCGRHFGSSTRASSAS